MRLILTLIAVGLVLGVLPARAADCVYVSDAKGSRILVFRQDSESGELTPAGEVATAGTPGSLCVDPERKYLFAALRSAKTIASYRIDPQSGELEHLSTTAAKEDPAYVATDRTGRWLLSAYYRAGQIAVHRLDDGGTISPEGMWTETADKAHAIVVDRSNRFLFVPHTGPEKIFQFRFDAQTGRVTPNDPPVVETEAGIGPRHIWFHPAKDVAFVSEEQGSSMGAYRFDPEAGTLSPLEGQHRHSTLPDGFSQRNSCSDIEVTPDGRYVYVGNRGHDSIAGFAFDDDGRISSLGTFATEQTPRSFNIDPSGRFLYAAGQGSGRLAAYRIDESSGALRRFATYKAGSTPWWVLVVHTEN
ncbi:6-phosphogluconolactonase [Maioricimonas rarisocia]|uniref:6-phosphogluconolactonase n=1 Tax=Maioricimonas rarisocia TaxID=2528026 RepID=A0A517Z3I5_9PLAN|nr:lactonase family protein [Maioricimonas rarisocia]QDU37052.1 6-phosphogluconolactonase [Maioricimonas rarisocia]